MWGRQPRFCMACGKPQLVTPAPSTPYGGEFCGLGCHKVSEMRKIRSAMGVPFNQEEDDALCDKYGVPRFQGAE